MKYLFTLLSLLFVVGCGGPELTNPCNARGCANSIDVPPLGSQDDGSVVRGIAVVNISSEQESAMHKVFNFFQLPHAYASTATTSVVYNNAAAVTYTVNVAALVPGAFSGLNLNLGSFNITALKDDDIEVCGPLNDTQCVNAYLRVYTTGASSGFVNTTHVPGYSVPLYTSGINPAVPVPLSPANLNIKTVLAMDPSKHVVNLVDFVTTSYTLKADFSNAGFGSYSATYVIEYALSL